MNDKTDEYPSINGLRCPACGWESLFVANGNYVTCGNLECTNPDYAEAIQQRHQAELDAAEEDMRLEKLDSYIRGISHATNDLMRHDRELFLKRMEAELLKLEAGRVELIERKRERLKQLQPQAGEGGEG